MLTANMVRIKVPSKEVSMNKTFKFTLLVFIYFCIMSFGFSKDIFIKIYVAHLEGVYYTVGTEIKDLIGINPENTYKWGVEALSGSVANLDKLHNSGTSFAIAQADVVDKLYNKGLDGTGKRPQRSLRVVAGLYSEPAHLLCRADSEVKTFTDIKGKIINVGPSGTGMSVTFSKILHDLDGIREEEIDLRKDEIGTSIDNLVKGTIHCTFYIVGIGARFIQDLFKKEEIIIVPLDNHHFAELVKKNEYYNFETIKKGTYKGRNDNSEVTTISVKALIVTIESTKADIVKVLINTILDNFADFKDAHGALGNLTKNDLAKPFTNLDFHKDANTIYEEAGLR